MPPVHVQCTVTNYRWLTPTVFELSFSTDPDFTFTAGQFISVVIPGAGPGGRNLRRAYSIASPPQKRPFELCVKRVEGGPGTEFLHSLRPGDRFEAYVPYGDFVYKTPTSRHACFLATGTGVAPFRAMIQSLEYQASPPLSATLFFGAAMDDEVLYEEELSRRDGLEWNAAISRSDSSGRFVKGRITDLLRSAREDFPWLETDYYLCGNGAMIQEVTQILLDKGVDKKSIHREIYYKPKATP